LILNKIADLNDTSLPTALLIDTHAHLCDPVFDADRERVLSCLLAESDSPVLGPSPQERNEPSNILLAVKAIAELKGIKEAEVAERMAENTRRLYGDVFS
jgi:Tat protein secretion system quality control protein TatD with DNase activity